MTKVITYGTYDLLHYGHIRLLERARELGDYLIVGVTADDFDKNRGKINVQQSLIERIESVRATGLADEIIVEEYEGQKIDDIRRYDVDIFTVGSDWKGTFDYLNEYCKVVYLDRTDGVSSSEIRAEKREIKLGLVGDSSFLNKVYNESRFVNGIYVTALCTDNPGIISDGIETITSDYEAFLNCVDAVYVRSVPEKHYCHIKRALELGKHVLCESPIGVTKEETSELFTMAENSNLILMEAIKTAYATAYTRLLLLIKGGKIGDVVSIDSTCTSLKEYAGVERTNWEGIHEWAPTALLPILQLLGVDYKKKNIVSKAVPNGKSSFTKIDFIYDHAVASIKIGDGIKSEGELIISGTKGYIYVPAPWWKTDYFEIRYENISDNKRYFYQLDGEGIRYELVAFARAVEGGMNKPNIDKEVSLTISDIISRCYDPKEVNYI